MLFSPHLHTDVWSKHCVLGSATERSPAGFPVLRKEAADNGVQQLRRHLVPLLNQWHHDLHPYRRSLSACRCSLPRLPTAGSTKDRAGVP